MTDDVGRAIWRAVAWKMPFQSRGLTDRTIRALVDCNIDAPEHLLFMTKDQIKSIPGVGKISLAEILAYRAKFIPR